jgi:hypothetical protein
VRSEVHPGAPQPAQAFAASLRGRENFDNRLNGGKWMSKDQSDFGNVGLYYCNGRTFVLDEKRKCIARDYLFYAERMKVDPGKDHNSSSLVVVGFGADLDAKQAVNSLRKVIKLIKAKPWG